MPEAEKKHITIGILAHVDAGKTTLSEQFLYETGVKKQAGRVLPQEKAEQSAER